jgi:hypothetical protein
MKFYQAITILILISYIYADVSYCDNAPVSPTKTEDCTSHKANGGYCCFVKEKSGNDCNSIGPNAYKYVKDYVKYYKKCYPKSDGDCEEYKDFSFDCKSSYLVLSLFSLILLFL